MAGIMKQTFGMPLHCSDIFFFNAFNDAVGTEGCDCESGGCIFNCLMVVGVDFIFIAENGMQNASRRKLHFMGGCSDRQGRIHIPLVVIHRVFRFFRDILNQRAALGDIDQLDAPADPEHRFSCLCKSAVQTQIGFLNVMGNHGAVCILFAVVCRITILAAGHDQPVALRGDPFRILITQASGHHGNAAAGSDIFKIAFIVVENACLVDEGLSCAQADQRFCHRIPPD